MSESSVTPHFISRSEETETSSESGYSSTETEDEDELVDPTSPSLQKKGKDRIKGPWSPEEDKLLQQLVEKHGQRNWALIAESIPGRSGRSCLLRWFNPKERLVFSPEEDETILRAHAQFGKKWAKIARMLYGRTEYAIRNHWNSTLKRRSRSIQQPSSKRSAIGGSSSTVPVPGSYLNPGSDTMMPEFLFPQTAGPATADPQIEVSITSTEEGSDVEI